MDEQNISKDDTSKGNAPTPRVQDKPKKTPPTVVQKPIVKMVSVMFRENRKFDLHVGREMITFKGREIKQIPAEWLLHRDFLQASDQFIVKGV